MNRNILITGATDGIGLALARRYAARGARLILIGRRPLAELDDPIFTPDTYCCADLADLDSANRVSEWLAAAGIDRLHRVYLNAGIGYVGPLARQTADDIRRMVAVNFLAPVALSHRLANLVEAATGTIAYISSAASTLPTPDYAVYTATKAALDGFVTNFRSELHTQGRPIRVSLIAPGATHTGLHAKSGATTARMDWTRFPAADRVAAQIIEAVERGRPVAAIGTANALLRWSGRHASRWLIPLIRRRQPALDPVPPSAEAPHAVITGAAAGIGQALARRFAAAGYAVTIIDRDALGSEALQAELVAQGYDVHFLAANLSQPADLDAILAGLATRPPVTVLIHNAGINAVGPFLASNLDEQVAVTGINFTAPLILTGGLLRLNRLTAGGSLVFVASLSHFIGYPGASVYAAGKDGLTSFAHSLAASAPVAQRHAMTVFPGPTRTAHAARYSPDNRRAHRRMPPERLADAIYRAVTRKQATLIPGLPNRVLALAGRLAPGLMAAAMRRALFHPLTHPRTPIPDSRITNKEL